jgi:ADP-L-glycero-D-manno-heptose 6-epimerase
MILVTGGAGFIGSNLVAALSNRRAPVVVCDHLGQGEKWRNLAKHQFADLVAPAALAEWLSDRGTTLEAIVHLGAISSTAEMNADLVFETNVRLSCSLWNWCARNQKRFLYASSAATYGDGAEGFNDDCSIEALARLHPLNLYGWSKHRFDCHVAHALVAGHAKPPQWAGLKFFNVYGPNEYHKDDMQSVICKRYRDAAAGKSVTLFKSDRADYADGGQRRDFVHVDDCIDVLLWLLDHPQVNGLFNVGTGTARSFREVAEILFSVVGHSTNIHYVDMPAAVSAKYQYFTEATLDRLRSAGFEKPFIPLEQGLRQYVERYLSQQDRYR